MNVKARDGGSYFLTLSDDYSPKRFVHLLSHHFKALDGLSHSDAEVETQLERNRNKNIKD